MHFTIRTDYVSLKHLLEQRLTHTLQHKSLCKLLGLDYTIQYKRGVENRAADSLSRVLHEPAAGTIMAVTELIPQWVEELKDSYSGDAWAAEILAKSQAGQARPTTITVHCGIIRKKCKGLCGLQQPLEGSTCPIPP
jgi:hypothetical protein